VPARVLARKMFECRDVVVGQESGEPIAPLHRQNRGERVELERALGFGIGDRSLSGRPRTHRRFPRPVRPPSGRNSPSRVPSGRIHRSGISPVIVIDARDAKFKAREGGGEGRNQIRVGRSRIEPRQSEAASGRRTGSVIRPRSHRPTGQTTARPAAQSPWCCGSRARTPGQGQWPRRTRP
jgi:hypothetical protein